MDMNLDFLPHTRMDVTQIDDDVFIGTNACCMHHFTSELLNKGVTCDISLEGEALDQPFGVSTFLWLPTPDHAAPSITNVMIGTAALDEMLRQRQKVFIHCKNGHGRAPTFYMAFLILKRGISFEDALARITSKRMEIHLDEPQAALLRSLAERKTA